MSHALKNDKTKAIEDFLEALDKNAFLQKPELPDTVRSREKTERFEFEAPKERAKKAARPRVNAPEEDTLSNEDVTQSLKAIQAVCSSILGS